MGIKERQERGREAVRSSILDAARELFVTDGFEQVSIRKIAERVEYSPAAIYGYFPSKDDIFFALAEDGFRLMYGDGQFLRALENLPPLEQVRELFWRFYKFSCEHPQYFALMFVDRSVPRIGREYERFTFAREGKQILTARIEEAVRAGVLPASIAPEVMVHIVSCALVGVAAMRLSDRLPNGNVADALARDVLNVTLAGLQTAPQTFFSSPACPLDEIAPFLPDAHVSSQEPRS